MKERGTETLIHFMEKRQMLNLHVDTARVTSHGVHPHSMLGFADYKALRLLTPH